jgi:adenine-specific DNA-methyltransferase
VLLQRTTAKEQARRLIAAEMSSAFLAKHGAVTVENHLNMLVPTTSKPLVSPNLLSLFLNSVAADRAFRCISGSVAVSAYELESLPLPSGVAFRNAAGRRRTRHAINGIADAFYAGRRPSARA